MGFLPRDSATSVTLSTQAQSNLGWETAEEAIIALSQQSNTAVLPVESLAHGFPANQLLGINAQSNRNNLNYSLATPNDPTKQAQYVAIAIDANNFAIYGSGLHELTHGLPQGTSFYLSGENAGELVAEANLDAKYWRQKILTTLDAGHFVVELQPMELPFLKWGKLSNLAQSTLNSSVSGTAMNFDIGSFQGNNILFTPLSTGLRVKYDWPSCKIYGSQYGTSQGGQRKDTGIRITRDGLLLPFYDRGASGYIRGASGDNEAGSKVNDPVQAVKNQVFGLNGYLTASPGVINTPLNSSKIELWLV